MKSYIRGFAQFNRRICRRMESKCPQFFGIESSYGDDLWGLIDARIRRGKAETILEVGGIDRPILSRGGQFKYVGLDIEERATCYEVYDQFLVQSVEDDIPLKADMVISTTLLEHVRDNKRSIRSIYQAMNCNGFTAHYIPSKYHFYSIALRLVGPRLQKVLIDTLRPDARAVSGYPAFFDNCSPRQMRQIFENAGFRDIQITPYYKATDYFAFFVPAYIVIAVFENLFEKLGWSAFCSGFIITAHRG